MEGFFKPKNPKKYKGNPTNIIYRSSWEFKVMMDLDHDKDVINWGSEEIIIPYRSPIDGRIRRYFVDFVVTRKVNGKPQTFLIEVKPYKQTKPPIQPKKKNKKFLTETVTYAINKAKWKAAEEFCADRGWIFEIYTEKKLGLPS